MCLVLQNALRAVVELHGESSELPRVKILISKGREDVVIKVISFTIVLCISCLLHVNKWPTFVVETSVDLKSELCIYVNTHSTFY